VAVEAEVHHSTIDPFAVLNERIQLIIDRQNGAVRPVESLKVIEGEVSPAGAGASGTVGADRHDVVLEGASPSPIPVDPGGRDSVTVFESSQSEKTDPGLLPAKPDKSDLSHLSGLSHLSDTSHSSDMSDMGHIPDDDAETLEVDLDRESGMTTDIPWDVLLAHAEMPVTLTLQGE
jgi:hypothetical protein